MDPSLGLMPVDVLHHNQQPGRSKDTVRKFYFNWLPVLYSMT